MDDRAFVINVADARATHNARVGTWIDFQPEGVHFDQTGINIHVLEPGKPNCLYHSEPVQEDFLVLHGECLVILDGAEVPLKRWDFVHCPPGAEHVFVGAGDGPCAVLMIGARHGEDAAHYPVNEVAARHGASVSEATDSPPQAYSIWPEPDEPAPNPWPPGRR